MTSRKTKTTSIDPIALATAALKACKCSADYHRLGNTTEPTVFQTAWNSLPEIEQQRINDIVTSNAQPNPQVIADELAACGTLIQLQAVKAHHGELVIKSAWQLLPQSERDRLTAICKKGTPPEPEISTIVEATEPPKRTLIELLEELQQLDDLLDTIDGDIPAELQTVVDVLLAQHEATHEAVLEKLDSYAALIQSRLMWAAARKAEAERLVKLSEKDIKTVEFLKGRLKAHLEVTAQNKIRTKRFNISIRTAGGKQALRLNVENPKDLPERFQRAIVEPDTTALREALEASDPEAKEVAYFTERTTYVAIN